jgi:hypothetical protein
MKLILVLIVLLNALEAQSGHNDKTSYPISGTGIISGTVIHDNTSNPIEYASVTLHNKESNEIIEGQLTDELGFFLFHKISKGYYFVEINFMGVQPWKSNEIHISKKNNRIDIGSIALQNKFIEAASVDIKETKEIYEFETDKIVYNPENDIIASAGSAKDILENTPMVTVDQDGEVQLRGKSNVNILVDGRKNRIDLANISGSQIKKVEVITSPSAKYDPEGMAGIINIVLKKGSTDGFTGNIKLDGDHTQYHSIDQMHGLNAFGNYKKGPLNLFSSIGFNNEKLYKYGYRNTITTYIDTVPTRFGTGHLIYGPDIVDSLFYNYDNNIERLSANLRFGVDYFFNYNLLLTSEFKISSYTKIDSTTQTFIAPDGLSEGVFSETGKDAQSPSFDLEYLFILDKEFKVPDQELKFLFSIDKGENHETKRLLYSSYADTKSSDFNNGIEIDFTYKTPFLSNQKIEFGYDAKLIDNTNVLVFDSQFMKFSFDHPNTITMVTNTFEFKRDIHSFFIEYENQITEKLSLKPSFRYEYIDKKVTFASPIGVSLYTYNNILKEIIDEADENSPYIINRSASYPSLHIQYNFTTTQSLTFGFSKRVDRPGGGDGESWQIMPFPKNLYNERFVFIGNPYLKPEYSNQYELNYSSPIPMGFANLNIFYNEVSNLIDWYDDDSYGSFDILTFRNVDNAYTSGINFFTMFMGQTLGGGYTKTNQRDDNNPDDYELNEQSERFNIFSKIKLPEEYIKLFDFEFDLFWTKTKVPSGTMFGDKGTAWANLGFSKKLMDNRLTCSFTIDNLFDSGGFQMKRTKPVPAYFYNTGTANGQIQESVFSYEEAYEFSDVSNMRSGRTFKVTLKYQLGKISDDKKSKFGRSQGDGGSMIDMGY